MANWLSGGSTVPAETIPAPVEIRLKTLISSLTVPNPSSTYAVNLRLFESVNSALRLLLSSNWTITLHRLSPPL